MPALLKDRYLWLFLALYGLSVGVLAAEHGPVGDALAVLAIFGIALPGLALLACVRLPQPPAPAPALRGEGWMLLGLLAALSAFLAAKGSILGALLPPQPAPRLHDSANTLLKLLVFVAIPAAELRWWHGRWPAVGRVVAGTRRLWLVFALVGTAAVAVQFVIGTGAKQLLAPELLQRHWLIGLLLCLAWMTVEAGVVEEFFFRYLLQSRLAALTGSQTGGIVLSALAFGLAHAPGMFLRGAGVDEGLGEHPGLLLSAAYTIAMQGVIGLLFGVLWARTRSFALVVALHGLIDTAANAALFMQTWGL